MTKRSYKMRIEDILHALNKIDQYTLNMSYNQFTKNELIIDAVVRKLEIIEEAARAVPDSIAEQYPEVSWHRMAGLRNILIHEYFGVDKRIVWEIITNDLPNEKPLLEFVMRELEE